MITIKSDQEKQLSFDLEISGSSTEPDVRLIMETNSGMDLMFKAEMSHGTAKVVIPELGPILEAFENRNVSLKLETIVDGNWSEIWEDLNVTIEEPVKVTTKKPLVEDTAKTETKKTIKVKSIKETEIKKDPEDGEVEFDIDPDDESTDLAKDRKAKKETYKTSSKKKKTEKHVKVSMKEMFMEEDE